MKKKLTVKTKLILYQKDIVDALCQLVLFSMNVNTHYGIREHVAWITMSFENLDAFFKRTGINTSKIISLVNCPKHGWALSLKRPSSNKCSKCYKNRVLYKKRVKKRTPPVE